MTCRNQPSPARSTSFLITGSSGGAKGARSTTTRESPGTSEPSQNPRVPTRMAPPSLSLSHLRSLPGESSPLKARRHPVRRTEGFTKHRHRSRGGEQHERLGIHPSVSSCARFGQLHQLARALCTGLGVLVG